MKYIFFGTPEFAAIILQKLIASNMPPLALVCNPDRPQGRKKIIIPPPTKQRIMNYELGIREKIDILQPEVLDDSFLNKLKSYEADFYVVAAYSKILKNELINIPPKGVIGVHPSLLPKLRGASPIQSAILNGLTTTGVTLFLIDEKVDHGAILARQILNWELNPPTGGMDYEELSQKLAELSGDLFIDTLPRFTKGEIKPEPQNEDEATFTKKFITQDGEVNIEDLKKAMSGIDRQSVDLIDRKIKGLNPEPGVFTFIDGKRTKLLSSDIKNGKLELKEIQFEGKNPIPFSSYGKPLI